MILKRILVALAPVCAFWACCAAEDLPAALTGTFVQRKRLADVGVTLVSRGTFRFERGRHLVWQTLSPVASTFTATPTAYSVTVNGQTKTYPITVDVTSLAKIFEIKEMKEFVKSVRTVPETGFPRQVTVAFKNGDALEIALTPQP